MYIHDNFPEYKAIKLFYKDRKAKRSGIPYINHINEGLFILDNIKASIYSMRAYCLHPLIQDNEYLKDSFTSIKEYTNNNIYVASLAFEYRNIANSYLSDKKINSFKDIKLSPLIEVNDMLLADKIQNYKDFDKNRDKYKNKTQLSKYFRNWFKVLEKAGYNIGDNLALVRLYER